MVIYEADKFCIEKKDRGFRDCLELRVKIKNEDMNIAVVYMGTGRERRVLEQNKAMMNHLAKKIEEAERNNERYIITGDFNGHLGFVGYQEENENGRAVNSFMEETGLILLNLDDKCKGVYTWQRGDSRSVIDLVMINDKGYETFKGMSIDENREEIDISDHCLITMEISSTKQDNQWKEWKERFYYSTRKEKMERYRLEVEENIDEMENITMTKINEIIRKSAEEHLKTKYKKRVDDEGKEEPPWINEKIRKEIAKRRRLNKEHRNVPGGEYKQIAWNNYKEQKDLVKRMISEEMGQYERKTAQEIRDMKKGKDMWKMINKLKGGRIEKKDILKLYTEEGVEIDEINGQEEIKRFWQGIYNMHENKMEEVWNETKKIEYDRKLREAKERERNPGELWLPRLGDPYANVKVMKFNIEEEDVEKVLRGLKSRKAAGVDGLRSELYKELATSNISIRALRVAMEKVINEGGEPTSWKKSRTKMIEKKKKPTVEDLRPIALTDVSYKMMMSIVKEKVEEHIVENKMRRDEQAGFTKGREILDNLMILQECVRQSYSRKEELVVIAIDFKKAYDSIKRETVLEVMKDYKMKVELIEFIKRLYSGDSTRLEVGDIEVDMKIDCGIRQGCTASPVIFKMITYKIIEELKRKAGGVMIGDTTINNLFFADDGLLLAKGVEEAKKLVRILKESTKKYGLEMNTAKSKCLIYNEKETIIEMEGMEVVKEIKYLGVKVENKRGLYEGQRKGMIEKVKRMSNMAYSVMEKSCHKVLIGKVYWKSIVLPSVLFAMEVIDLREEDIEKMQRQENLMMRRMLRAPKYATKVGMRGEIGMGTMKSRIVRGRMQYLRRKMQGNNELIKRVIRNMKMNNIGWWKRTQRYMEWANITWEQIIVMTEEEVRKKITERVEEEWRGELQEKSTMWLYRMYKDEMREERIPCCGFEQEQIACGLEIGVEER